MSALLEGKLNMVGGGAGWAGLCGRAGWLVQASDQQLGAQQSGSVAAIWRARSPR
jgi:hypothetical protein